MPVYTVFVSFSSAVLGVGASCVLGKRCSNEEVRSQQQEGTKASDQCWRAWLTSIKTGLHPSTKEKDRQNKAEKVAITQTQDTSLTGTYRVQSAWKNSD